MTASISAAVRGTNDHLAIGIGGTRQAVLAAAALRCLGGELQAQLWPTRRAEIEEAQAHGIDDLDRDLHDRRPRAAGGDRRRDRRLERRPAARRPLPRPTPRARTRSSCAPAATGCASSTASTSSRATAAKKSVAELTSGMPSKEEVVEALRQVEDPELGMDIVELGLFYDAEIEGDERQGALHAHVDGLPGRRDDPGGHRARRARDPRRRGRRERADLRARPGRRSRMSDDAKFILGFG